MEIRIDERLVAVFNEVVEKDDKPFNGEKNLEKAINSHLADFFVFVDNNNNNNNNEFLSEEARDNLVDFLVEDFKEDDKVGQALALLRELLKAAAGK